MREHLLTKSRRQISVLLIVVLSALAGMAEASQLRPLNLHQMSLRADRIFAGRCVDVRTEDDPHLRQPVTFVTLAVTRAVKGTVHGLVTIKLLGRQDGRDPAEGEIEGLPRFTPGEEVVLFLYGDSSRGLTSPVGFGQGKFVIRKDKEGRRVALNGFANRNLLQGLNPEAERRIGAAGARWKGRPIIPESDLLDLARSLVEEARP